MSTPAKPDTRGAAAGDARRETPIGGSARPRRPAAVTVRAHAPQNVGDLIAGYVAGLGRTFCLGHSDQNIRLWFFAGGRARCGGTGVAASQRMRRWVSATGTSAHESPGRGSSGIVSTVAGMIMIAHCSMRSLDTRTWGAFARLLDKHDGAGSAPAAGVPLVHPRTETSSGAETGRRATSAWSEKARRTPSWYSTAISLWPGASSEPSPAELAGSSPRSIRSCPPAARW
jgi:hypothetical protein